MSVVLLLQTTMEWYRLGQRWLICFRAWVGGKGVGIILYFFALFCSSLSRPLSFYLGEAADSFCVWFFAFFCFLCP